MKTKNVSGERSIKWVIFELAHHKGKKERMCELSREMKEWTSLETLSQLKDEGSIINNFILTYYIDEMGRFLDRYKLARSFFFFYFLWVF